MIQTTATCSLVLTEKYVEESVNVVCFDFLNVQRNLNYFFQFKKFYIYLDICFVRIALTPRAYWLFMLMLTIF